MREHYNHETGYYKDKKVSECDFNQLELLFFQQRNQILNLCSSTISYISTQEGIDLIFGRYDDDVDCRDLPNPDVAALQSVSLGLLASINYLDISIDRYEMLLKRQAKGEITFSLQPNRDIIVANIFNVLSSYYLLSGAIGIYFRDINQPVFGI